MGMYKDLDIALQDYCNHLKADYNKVGYKTGRDGKEYYYEIGRKYAHIIMSDDDLHMYKQRSSHSWIMLDEDKKFKRGDILKSATWRGPARNFERGNVLTGEFKHIRWCGV